MYLPHRDGLYRSTKKVSHLNKESICHHIPQHSSVKDTNSSEIALSVFHTSLIMLALMVTVMMTMVVRVEEGLEREDWGLNPD